ncbi:MAG: MotA/TolQ/ExbB proton channel family protein [Gammaproteobacteria bacterium]|nr:MotA/TolQ/ExbB proton channel family protein [Gammaproteobacteria bacterium]
MIEQLMSGGWVMVPLAVFSIVALAICLNRFWQLGYEQVFPSMVQEALTGKESIELAPVEGRSSSLQNVALGVLNHRNDTVEIAVAAMEDVLITEVQWLERYLTTLGTIASISPLLGLLGTVLGMIEVFQALNTTGARDPSVFSGGIGEALITTAFGLCIAIPALICHRHFQRRVDEFAQQLEQEGRLLIGRLFRSEN